jgi:hypothetical protein
MKRYVFRLQMSNPRLKSVEWECYAHYTWQAWRSLTERCEDIALARTIEIVQIAIDE